MSSNRRWHDCRHGAPPVLPLQPQAVGSVLRQRAGATLRTLSGRAFAVCPAGLLFFWCSACSVGGGIGVQHGMPRMSPLQRRRSSAYFASGGGYAAHAQRASIRIMPSGPAFCNAGSVESKAWSLLSIVGYDGSTPGIMNAVCVGGVSQKRQAHHILAHTSLVLIVTSKQTKAEIIRASWFIWFFAGVADLAKIRASFWWFEVYVD